MPLLGTGKDCFGNDTHKAISARGEGRLAANPAECANQREEVSAIKISARPSLSLSTFQEASSRCSQVGARGM